MNFTRKLRAFFDNVAINYKSNLGIANSNEYFNLWYSKLIEILQNSGFAKKTSISSTAQVFTLEHRIYSRTIYFNFDINYLIINIKKAKIESYALNSIGTVDGAFVKYYACSLDDKVYTPITQPVIAVPFNFIKDTSFIIVDGNHRLSHVFLIKFPK